MFDPIDPQQSFPKLEKDVLRFWKKNRIFEKSLAKRKKAKRFNFYDGPPFATGLPHYGHILAMAIKDTVVRYKTMRGFYVPRRFGWDCHGLPVEYEVEKELKISGKPEIERYGIAKFNQKCRDIVLRYTSEWKKVIQRMGRWGDLEHTYVTMDNDYIESIWWVFQSIWNKGLVYQGFKTMPYCPRCGTPLSNFETNQGYQDNVPDPSIFIKFKIRKTLNSQNNRQKQFENCYFLVWTTTPWTLPGNAALAVGKDINYVKIRLGKECFILAQDRLSVIDDKYKIIDSMKGEVLEGIEYEPLYNFLPLKQKAHYVALADFVSTEEGTGIVHIAPAFGEDDLNLGQKLDLPIIQTVDKNGRFIKEVRPWAGEFVKSADPKIIKDLEKKGVLYKQETIRHTYPFCWRCDTPLIYYAVSTWFIKVSEIRQALVKNNDSIHWVPNHIKKGRFGKWLEEAHDWAVSRNRYWGAPVPIWQCQQCKKYECIGSREELSRRAIKGYKKTLDLHRPDIDKVALRCSCGGTMYRIEEVFDCWFESGSMPYAQFHYPFEDKPKFKDKFPADFIAEGLDQTRGWFYTLHIIATILFKKPAFYNCIVNGIILAADGKKLSKRLKNYPEPEEIFANQGADALRWFLLSSPAAVAEDIRFSAQHVADTVRRHLLLFWNVYSFFVKYANIDKWVPRKKIKIKEQTLLDKWILARLNETIEKTTKYFDNYDLPRGIRSIEELITDLSTWYLRRSRKRRNQAFYHTIYEVLITMCKLIAPFAPYISESVYQNLRSAQDPQSVHLCDWPVIKKQNQKQKTENRNLLNQMQKVREIVEKAHALRAEKGIKVRQPLSKLIISSQKIPKEKSRFADELLKIIADEVNVKQVVVDYQRKDDLVLDTKITPQLKEEGIVREIIRQIQFLRKRANLSPEDRIGLYLRCDDENVQKILKKHQKEIQQQTVSREILSQKPSKVFAEAKIKYLGIEIGIAK